MKAGPIPEMVNSEKKTGKIRKRIGDAKEAVATLKGELSGVKKLDRSPASCYFGM